jgi:transposase-like protein
MVKRAKPGPKGHSPEVKAAVTAALLAGQGQAQVAREYHLPLSTVGSWIHEIRGNDKSPLPRSDSQEIGLLLLDYIKTTLRVLKRQVEAAGDANYLAKQSGTDFAVLHGVLADKVIRLLEAATFAEPESQSDQTV